MMKEMERLHKSNLRKIYDDPVGILLTLTSK